MDALREIAVRRDGDIRGARRARGSPRRASRCGVVLRGQPLRDRRPLSPSRRLRAGSAATGRSASTTSGGCSRSKGPPDALRGRAIELAAIAPVRRCDALAEISGLFHTAGSLHLLGHGELAFHLDVSARPRWPAGRSPSSASSASTARSARTAGAPSTARRATSCTSTGQPPRSASCVRPGSSAQAARPLSRPPRRVVGRRCCRAAYVRGALLGAGSVSGPRRPHLELRFAEVDGAAFLVRIGGAGGRRAPGTRARPLRGCRSRTERSRSRTCSGAGRSERRRARHRRARRGRGGAREREQARERRSREPRADGEAAHAQLRAVRELEERGELASLPVELQEMAALRVRSTLALSFRELGAKCEPRAPKAAVQRRLAAARGTGRG